MNGLFKDLLLRKTQVKKQPLLIMLLKGFKGIYCIILMQDPWGDSVVCGRYFIRVGTGAGGIGKCARNRPF